MYVDDCPLDVSVVQRGRVQVRYYGRLCGRFADDALAIVCKPFAVRRNRLAVAQGFADEVIRKRHRCSVMRYPNPLQ